MASMSGSAGNDRDNQLATFQVRTNVTTKYYNFILIFILYSFQAATGLEDIETSISVLEQHGWNLAVCEC